MKVTFTLAVTLLLFHCAPAALLFEDRFAYAPGNLGAVGSAAGWSNSNAGVTVSSNSLDGSGFGLAASAGNKVTTTTASSAGTYNEFSSGILSGAVYLSCLFRVNSTAGLSTNGAAVVGLLRQGSASSYYADACLRLNGSAVQLGLAKLRSTYQWIETPLVVGKTCLVVVKYQFVPGSYNDVVSLWLDPVSLGGNEPPADITFGTGGDGNDTKGIGRCYIYGGMSVDVDELRIGSTWADVTPGSCVGAGIGQNPTNRTVAPGNTASFTCIGTGTNPTYQWQTNQGGGWVDVGGGAGNASVYTTPPATLAMDGLEARCIVSVACNTSSATSAVATLSVKCVSASISAGPTNRAVPAGARASFAVTANGSDPAYQWQTNYGSGWVNVAAGGTNAVYTTEPTTLAMNGLQVRCIVSVACDNSMATSSVATLMVSNVVAISSGSRIAIAHQTGNKVVLTWRGRGRLETADQLTGPWMTVPNASSPYTNLVGPTAQFFRLNDTVDTSTLRKKVMCGYQGWFKCPGDSGGGNSWFHWSSSQTQFTTNTITFEMWPEMSEYTNQYPAGDFTYPDGSQAYLFSSQDRQTVEKHFDWMLEYGIDGVFVQRFLVDIPDRPWMTNVLNNVRAAANRTGRAFAITYDMTGQSTSTLLSALTNDWNMLANSFRVTDDPRYLHHNGKPVLMIWGFFSDRMPASLAMQIINYFKSNANVTLIGGVEWYWENDTAPGWPEVFRSFDVISPWNVGNYMMVGTNKYAATNSWSSGIAAANAAGMLWLPVIYPGFSWDNLKKQPPGTTKISRLDGDFLWAQFYDLAIRNVDMAYVAMFDEVDEGTAIFKVSNSPPTQHYFLTYEGLPADWYMRLTAEGTMVLCGERPNQRLIPISP